MPRQLLLQQMSSVKQIMQTGTDQHIDWDHCDGSPLYTRDRDHCQLQSNSHMQSDKLWVQTNQSLIFITIRFTSVWIKDMVRAETKIIR